MVDHNQAEAFLDAALEAAGQGREDRAALDALPVPVYVTDAGGSVTYWNEACIALAGRRPQLGRDRWCVTWQLYTTAGDRLRHEDCPMAQAIKQQRAVRDVIAIAERPDRSRIAFRAYPTPLFDVGGRLIGAVNMLIDVTDEQVAALKAQAQHCRQLADAALDLKTSRILTDMAAGFDKTAGELATRHSA
jgi:PAS domain-containing protein